MSSIARKEPTAEQKARAQARREKFRSIANQLAKMSDEQRGELLFRIGAVLTCEGRTLSATNTLMCAMQHPNVSMVGGFKQWQKQGRSVRKGEHGLGIWIPIGKTEKNAETGLREITEDAGFVMGTVFDISQTEEMAERESVAAEIAAHRVSLEPVETSFQFMTR